MANYTNQPDAGIAPDDVAAGTGGDDFAFELEKQPGNRGGMVLVLLLVLSGGGLYFLYDQSSFAKASDPVTDTSVTDSAATTSALQVIRTQLDDTRRTVAIFERINARPFVAVSQLRSNPFSPARDTTVVEKAPVSQAPTEAERRAQLIAEASQDLAKLKLQSTTVNGENSTCTINRTLLHLGQQIKADPAGTEFVVKRVEIETMDGKPVTRVILSAYDVEFVLTRR